MLRHLNRRGSKRDHLSAYNSVQFTMYYTFFFKAFESTNMGWRIKFTNICQSMLKLKTHSGFHDLFRF
jgi:hypothetical protein